MKTKEYIFSIELPDETISSGRHEYNYYELDESLIDSSFYIHDNEEDMLETMEQDKIEWLFDVLNISHREV